MPSTARTSCCADPRRRTAGAALRRDGAARLRLHRPGDDGRGRARQGAAHGARGAGDRRPRTRASADGAWIVDFTNPVGIVTRALLDAGHRAVGLCNVAIGFQRRFARMLDVEPRRVLVDQVGLNHLTWVRAVHVDGSDVLPGLIASHGDELAGHAALPGSSSRSSEPFRPTTCATSTRTTRSSRSSATGSRARSVWPRSRRSCWRCTAIRASPKALAPRGARRRLLQRGGGRARGVAHGRRRRGPRGRHPERRDARRAGRR